MFSFLFSIFDENHDNKKNSPRWDAAFCGVTVGLFCLPMSHKKDARLITVNSPINSISVVFLHLKLMYPVHVTLFSSEQMRLNITGSSCACVEVKKLRNSIYFGRMEL